MTGPEPSGEPYIGRHRWSSRDYMSSTRVKLLLSQLALPTRGMHEPRHLKSEEGSPS